MEIILSKINKNKNGCWIWKPSVNSAGYGQITINGKYWLAHRYSYYKSNGSIEAGDVIRHVCHNTRCCNPDHLKRGTHKDNWRDSESMHRTLHRRRSKKWIVGRKVYNSIKEFCNNTGISIQSIVKYTDVNTRIFDTAAYRRGCKVANRAPKI